MAISANKVTRFGLDGGIWSLGGGFSTEEEEEEVDSTPEAAAVGGDTGTEYENWRSKINDKNKRSMRARLRDDEEVAALLILQMIRRG